MKIITYNLKLNNIKLSKKFILVFLLLFSIIIPTNRSIAQPNYILEGAPYFDEYGIEAILHLLLLEENNFIIVVHFGVICSRIVLTV